MKKVLRQKFKKGAASFYIVAFSTLILVIIAASFAGVIISAVTRTSNDDLSQSAYDAALAGVEDAKVAFSNYQRCVAGGRTYEDKLSSGTEVTCQDIVYWMNHASCDMTGLILGRISKQDYLDGKTSEVPLNDTVTTTDGNVVSDLNQAYTCTMIETVLNDYRATLTSASQVRVVKVDFENGVDANQIVRARLSWYSNRDDVSSGTGKYDFGNILNSGDGTLSSTSGYRVAFQPASTTRTVIPPTIEVQMVQTAQNFSLADFDNANGNTTDRATLYLVPSNSETAASGSVDRNYTGVYKGSGTGNVVSAAQIASTNNRTTNNVPYVVYCDEKSTDEFACSAILELPGAVNGARSNDTFMFLITLPYGEPDTDFALEFWCADGAQCTKIESNGEVSYSNLAQIKGAQIVIDSTGRANDLYRRVEVRLESSNTSFAYPVYAMEMLGSGSDWSIKKNLTVTSERNLRI